MSASLLVHKDGAIGWLRFDNPARLNAITVEMWSALVPALDDFAKDDAIRVVVLAGEGNKAFASGADIAQMERRISEGDRQVAGSVDPQSPGGRSSTSNAMARLRGFEKPTISMIHGYCLGGGLATAMNTDLRIAAEDARFSVPAAKLGVGYSYDAVDQLMQVVGPANAKDILFTGRQLNAAEALRFGLVNQVLPKGELDAHVAKLATTIAANAPLTIMAAKKTVEDLSQQPERRNRDRAEAAIRQALKSEDFAEGRRAFLEKRKPKFQGR